MRKLEQFKQAGDFSVWPFVTHADFERARSEVRPFVADAWIDRNTVDEQEGGIGKVGYEINFNREFYRYQPPRSLRVIDKELANVERRILDLLKEVTE